MQNSYKLLKQKNIKLYVIPCKLMELHASSWKCMQAHGVACKLMELLASSCNALGPWGILGNLVEPWVTLGCLG